MSDQWNCSRCHHQNSAEARFCTQCGQAQSGTVSTPAVVPVKYLLIGGGLALAGVLCVILLLGTGFWLGAGSSNPQVAEKEQSAETPVSTFTSAVVTEVTTPVEASTSAPNTPSAVPPTPAPLPTPTLGEPEFSDITFATGVTSDTQPIGPAHSFKGGITKVHVIFEYSNMSPADTWERVWYLDGKEMLRSTEPWSGAEAGMFDYFLEAGGTPLPPGEWKLELYVKNKLTGSGSFEVEAVLTPTSTRAPTFIPTPTPTPTVKVTSGSGGSSKTYQLAYTKWDGSFHNLYIADTNGQNEQLVIKRAAGPSWSPNGKQLFFFGEQGVNQQLAEDGRLDCEFGTISGGIVALDLPPSGNICQVFYGSWLCERKQVDVQSPPSDVCEQSGFKVFQNLDWKDGTARWASVSPDGAAVAFDGKPGGSYRIYFRSILNNAQFRFELIGEQGDWSPDGQKLVYRSGRDNKQGIWISNRDDTGHTLITNEGSDAFPVWSPDGQTIAFARDSGGGNNDIYVMNVDGSNIRRLTDSPTHDILPAFTPGGDIIFRSDRSGSWGIWKMSSGGDGQKEIIPNVNVGPDWAFSRMDVR